MPSWFTINAWRAQRFAGRSDRNGMRIVIELKRDVNPNVVLNNLYKHTQMQDTFGVIMLALVDGEPKILSLHQMLHYYIEHRKDVVIRRTRYELNRAQARAHILEGLLIALDHIDEVIRIIRSSRDDAESKARLMERFGLSEKQSQAILDMPASAGSPVWSGIRSRWSTPSCKRPSSISPECWGTWPL